MALTLLVPPGIGDFSAMYAKLCGIEREMIIRPASDGPHRLLPFLELLPKIKFEHYSQFPSSFSLVYTIPPGTDLYSLADGEYFFSINDWLESGRSADSWIPGPEIDYHYAMDIKPEHKAAVQEFMDELPIDSGVLIGVYSSAYGNSRHWGFWGPAEWFELLKEVRDRIPDEMNPIFIFIGAEYDLGISEALVKMMLEHNESSGKVMFRYAYTLGRFHIGATIELIKKLNYFFVFPSGLGFLADVVNTPHVMWFPPNLDRMRYTFSDPINNHWRTLHNLFSSPKDAATLFAKFGFSVMEDSYVHSLRTSR